MNPNATSAPVTSPSSGPETIVVSGGPPSTVKWRSAGVESVLREASVARTANVCGPSLSPRYAYGLAQPTQASSSSRHSNVASSSLAEKRNDGSEPLTPPSAGPDVIVVSTG